MSDFSQLCPLFTTGFYSEVSFYNIGFSALSLTHNALVGALKKASQPASFKFQRTVVITKVYAQKQLDGTQTPIILAKRHVGTGTAAGTTFASLTYSTTVTLNPVGRVKGMTTTSKTFAAADVLGFALKTKKTDAGRYNFIVRYKEK
jgi:hypothetical protein